MSWTIGRHRVEIQPPRRPETGLIILVDHRDVLPLVPDAKIQLGKIEARLRLALDHGVVRPELWVGEQRVPASPEGTEQEKAPEGASCEMHGGPGNPYRSADRLNVAKYKCAGCKKLTCSRCLAIDRVLCQRCFDAALTYERWLRDAHRRRRDTGMSIAVLATGALPLFACLCWQLWWQAALAALFTIGSASVAAYHLRGRRLRPGKVWESSVLLSLPPSVVADLSHSYAVQS
jgi:hypothetical protein